VVATQLSVLSSTAQMRALAAMIYMAHYPTLKSDLSEQRQIYEMFRKQAPVPKRVRLSGPALDKRSGVFPTRRKDADSARELMTGCKACRT
jgi:hypothetical protein